MLIRLQLNYKKVLILASKVIQDFNTEARLVIGNVRNQLTGVAVVKNENPCTYNLDSIDEYTKLIQKLLPEVRKNPSDWYELEAANLDRNTIRSAVNLNLHKELQLDRIKKVRASACHYAILGLANGIVDVALSTKSSKV